VSDALSTQHEQHPQRRILSELLDAPIVVQADADRVGQVVAQYVSNALKYSPDDRPVTVRLTVTGDEARVSVHDEGPGLPPDEQERVWEAFYRAPSVAILDGSAIGLGLGLYICRTIIERHGGRTGVDSAIGEGATFWFTLPLASAPATTADLQRV
jgi:signal transduction histidine kinase